jgi:phosphoribosylformylglycinamidine synthase
VLNTIDPYAGSIWAAAEAVAGAVASGANPDELVLIDNFIWPYPDEESLYDLDRAVDACVDFVQATGMPFISGKDSLSSTYRALDGSVIKIPPVLCISCFGRIADVTQTVSTDFKRSGSVIALVGQRNVQQMGGSTYFDVTGAASNQVPLIDLSRLTATLRSLHRAIQSGEILACHDISEGGLLAALAEMCLGGGTGAAVSIPANQRADYFLFNETAGCFVVELADHAGIEELFQGVPYIILGSTTADQSISTTRDNNSIFNIATDKLFKAWQKPMREVFGGC